MKSEIMPKRVLEKFEARFGKIKSKAEAQTVVDLTRQELVRRKPELLKAISKRVIVKEYVQNGRNTCSIRIPGFGVLYMDIYPELLYLSTIEIDGFVKDESSFRRLGLGKLLINIAKNFAKKKRVNKIILDCNYSEIPFFSSCEFKILEYKKNNVLMSWTLKGD